MRFSRSIETTITYFSDHSCALLFLVSLVPPLPHEKSEPTWHLTNTSLRSILAIDLGSTALRAAFVECKDPHHCYPVQNVEHARNNRKTGVPFTGMGDFSVACCPLADDPMAKIGAAAESEPGHISAKYLMYILAQVDDSVMADYPLSSGILDMKNHTELLDDCRVILGKLFHGLKERVDAFARKKRLCFDDIVLTIPAQWDSTFEKIYTAIIESVFTYDEDGKKVKKEVHFCGEADALARYVIIKEEGELEDWEIVLFLDFGGHSMSYSLMELKRTKGSMTFFELDSGGCAGGSEMWSHQVRLLIANTLQHMGVADPHGAIAFEYLQKFNDEKSTVINEMGLDKPVSLLSTAEPGRIDLPREEVRRCFDTALAKPFRMAKQQLRKLKAYKDRGIGVVVAGGTLLSTTAQNAVFNGSGIPEERIKHTANIDITWLSSCNCQGAALAHAQKMTVGQFFENGAVVALQQMSGRGSTRGWENIASLLVSNDKTYEVSLYNAYKDAEFKVVCHPGYSEEGKNAGENSEEGPNTIVSIPIGECYDLYQLRPQMAGTLTFEASLTSPSGTASSERTLHVKISRRARKNGPIVEVKELDLPLCIDPGHNAVHVDFDVLGEEERKRQEELLGGKRSSSKKKSATSEASRTKRKRKDTDTEPAQPSKRPRTRAAPGDDGKLQQLDYYANEPGAVTSPGYKKKRKATDAPESSSTATKRARTSASTSANRADNTNNTPDNQSDEDIQQTQESVAAQDGEQNEEQPQERSNTQHASQNDDDGEFVCLTCRKTFAKKPDLDKHKKIHLAEKARMVATATTRARTQAPAATADRPAAIATATSTHTNSSFAPRSSPPKTRRRQTEQQPSTSEQPAQPQSRRSPRKQTTKKSAAVATASAAIRQQPQRQPRSHIQPPSSQQMQEARPQAGPSQVQPQAEQAPKPLEEANTSDESVILDCITVRTTPLNRNQADQAADDEEKIDDEDEDDFGNGGNADDDDDEDRPSGSGNPGFGRLLRTPKQRENGEPNLGGPSSPILGEEGGSSSRAQGIAHTNDSEGNAEDQAQVPGPSNIARLQQTHQSEVHASPSPRGNRAVSAAERTKENRREEMTEAEASSEVLTGRSSPRRPTWEEKGKAKAVDKPAGKPKPKVSLELAPANRPSLNQRGIRDYLDQSSGSGSSSSSSAAASSSRSAGAASSSRTAAAATTTNAGPSSKPPNANTGKGKGKKAQEPSKTAATTTNTTTTTTTSSAAEPPSSSASTIPASPRGAVKGKGNSTQAKAKQPASATNNTTTTTTQPPPSPHLPPLPPLGHLGGHAPSMDSYYFGPEPPNPVAKRKINSLFSPSGPIDLQRLLASTAPPPIPDRPEPSARFARSAAVQPVVQPVVAQQASVQSVVHQTPVQSVLNTPTPTPTPAALPGNDASVSGAVGQGQDRDQDQVSDRDDGSEHRRDSNGSNGANGSGEAGSGEGSDEEDSLERGTEILRSGGVKRRASQQHQDEDDDENDESSSRPSKKRKITDDETASASVAESSNNSGTRARAQQQQQQTEPTQPQQAQQPQQALQAQQAPQPQKRSRDEDNEDDEEEDQGEGSSRRARKRQRKSNNNNSNNSVSNLRSDSPIDDNSPVIFPNLAPIAAAPVARLQQQRPSQQQSSSQQRRPTAASNPAPASASASGSGARRSIGAARSTRAVAVAAARSRSTGAGAAGGRAAGPSTGRTSTGGKSSSNASTKKRKTKRS